MIVFCMEYLKETEHLSTEVTATVLLRPSYAEVSLSKAGVGELTD